jgi:hypothetical protein
MRVQDDLDVRPRAVDLGMERELQRRAGAALAELAGEIDRHDVVRRERRPDRRARVDVEGAGIAARAAVAAVVDELRAGQHADRIDQRRNQRVRHVGSGSGTVSSAGAQVQGITET